MDGPIKSLHIRPFHLTLPPIIFAGFLCRSHMSHMSASCFTS